MKTNEVVRYINMEEFAKKSGVKESTIKKRYKDIPGITKEGSSFTILLSPFHQAHHVLYVLFSHILLAKLATHFRLGLIQATVFLNWKRYAGAKSVRRH